VRAAGHADRKSSRRNNRLETSRLAGAFTLIEILIVLSLLVLLASIAWPAMESQIKASEMPESAGRIRSMLFMARSEAMMEHRRFRIRFLPEHQQPLIEWEPDPITHAGVFELVPAGWAQEPMLLADVQVHQVRLGRPVWTMALSSVADDPEEEGEESELVEDEDEKREREEFLRSVPLGDGDSEEDEIDEDRPTIIFGVDGSTDWAVLILARVDPEEELEEEEPQIWVVLDARTGLSYLREKITEEQLADPEFYVEREKLELPDRLDVDDLTFEFGDALGGESFSMGEMGTGGEVPADDFDDATETIGDLQDEFDKSDGDEFSETGSGGGRGGRRGSGPAGGEGSRRGGGRRGDSDGGGGPRNEGDSELEKELDGSELSDEEREKIRKTLGTRGG
jgi:type II secretory pathway pseudopilin PulG